MIQNLILFYEFSQLGDSSINSSSSWLPLLFRVQDYRTFRNEESSNVSEGSNHEGTRQRWRELPPVPPQMALQALLQSQNYQTKAVLEGQGKVKPLTALRWVSKCCPDVPQSLINKLFRLRQIRVRSSSPPCKPSSVSSGQRLNRVSGKEVLKEGAVLVMPAAVVTLQSQEGMEVSGKTMHALGRTTHEPTPEEIEWLRSLILHMDKELIIINKPCGLAVQGGTEVRRSLDSMMGAALSFNYSEGPRLVHRLDKETSGAMVIGRTHQSTVFLHALLRIKSSEMTQLWKGHGQNIERRYWALVVGTPTKLQGRISSPLAKVSTSGGKLEKMRVTHRSHPDAQEAITDYQVLGPSALGCTWLELHPLTGRKHQIRVHCAEVLGTPIVGDYKYGWCALKNWPPKDEHNPENPLAPNDCKQRQKGDIFSNTPLLHLHCHKLSLPNVARIFKHQESAKTDYEAGQRMVQSCDDVLDVVAPLPPHMASSWNEKLVSGVDL
ncbi:unnamed protein product [Sphagnum jensenii]|uniref:Pseudouridine synthase RsuA/RluA-like domain-containing protein n=1 Tax=Sphagnum jensenii TaxID=128206 RepID=A0ABP0VZW8_9BRYO